MTTQLATVFRARAKLHGLDPHTARQRLQHQLQALSWQPAGLPTQGILCIREWRSAVPLHTADMRYTQRWQRQVQAQMADCAAQAARPIQGFVPANANAVLFWDEAERLACLARDWLQGAVRQHWWWEPLLVGSLLMAPPATRDASGMENIVAAYWLAAPTQVPTALAHLADNHHAVSFLTRLPQSAVLGLLQGVIMQFGLYHLSQAFMKAQVFATPQRVAPTVSSQYRAHGVTLSANPWQPWVDDQSLRALTPMAACVLGVSLGLHHHPARVRQAELAHAVSSWLSTNTTIQQAAQTQKQADQTPATPSSVHATTTITSPLPIATDEGPIGVGLQSSHRNLAASTTSADDLPQAVPPTQRSGPSRVAAKPSDDTWVVQTEFGGVFYLINAMLHLGWYADFTQPTQRGLDQDIYTLLAQIGEHTFGERFRCDALWETLAGLAGHDAQPPHSVAGEDGASTAPTGAELCTRLRALQQRLAHALGDSESADQIAFVCQHHARIAIMATRLDVFLSLDHLPIAIRLSGLDRDPGWVPAAGRVIAFHFD